MSQELSEKHLPALSRKEFKKQVFARDQNTCVVPDCKKPAVDAHHILDRSLWANDDPYPQGYVLTNGVSLCSTHHLDAECGKITPNGERK